MLPSPEDPVSILEAVRRAAAGALVLPDSDLSAIVDRLRPPADRLDVLTQRERQTLHLLAEGLSTGDVARHLGISPATVQTHVKNVLAKLGVHSKVQAVRVALLAGV
jgi:DNA-binding NarL/FixJ family response regulator